MTSPTITTQLVALDADCGAAPRDVIEYLATLVASAGRTTSPQELADAAITREAKAGTGVNGRVAIPHCRTTAVTEPTLAFARLSRPVDFAGPDGDADLVFLIAAPEGGGKAHLKLLSKLARALVRGDFIDTLRQARTPEEVVEAVDEVLNAGAANVDKQKKRIVAVTSCATGIAHTYMAADALEQSARGRDDIELRVEPQGSSGGNSVDPDFIARADAVIFAHDVAIRDAERFAGKPVVDSPVKRGINEPNVMIDEAIAAADNPNARRVPDAQINAASAAAATSWLTRIQQAIMTGVSYMVPFVAAGGLLLALGFLIGGYDVANGWQIGCVP